MNVSTTNTSLLTSILEGCEWNSTPPAHLAANVASTRPNDFRGSYRVMGIREKFRSEGLPWLRIELADFTGSFLADIKDFSAYDGLLSGNEVFQLHGSYADQKSQAATALSFTHDKHGKRCVSKLPITMLPDAVQNMLLPLAYIVHGIRTPYLKTMVESFLTCPDNRAYYSAPASLHAHHNFAGGLLLHSLDCAMFLKTQGWVFSSTKEHDLAMVAALLHDVGKLSHYADQYRLHGIPHELRSYEVLSRWLTYLDKKDAKAAEILRLAISPTHHRKYDGVILNMVRWADQISAARAAEKIAFAGAPEWQGLKKQPVGNNKRTYIRLPTTPVKTRP